MKKHPMFMNGKNTIKVSILPKAICRFHEIPIQIPMAFFTEVKKKKNPKISMKPQKILNRQSNLKKEQKNWKSHNSWFQTIL